MRGVGVEVVPGRGLHSVGAIAVVGDVEIALQDLVLGEGVLQCDRVAHLQDLAVHAGGLSVFHAGSVAVAHLQADLLHVLLGERRTAATDTAAGGIAERCAYHGLKVDCAMLVEPVVLNGDLSGLHLGGDLVERDVLAVLVEEGRQHRTVRQVHGGRFVLIGHREVRGYLFQRCGPRPGRPGSQRREGDAKAGDQHPSQDADHPEHQQRIGFASRGLYAHAL
ncbi:hypothetical protein SDC9_83635 [bioreactor metagenome]|uniref:Uncharacterized protein n=1 Tax=bioreactor metagenome TaxID=1076179 RepID=A0A644Z822_9ZZZZ